MQKKIKSHLQMFRYIAVILLGSICGGIYAQNPAYFVAPWKTIQGNANLISSAQINFSSAEIDKHRTVPSAQPLIEKNTSATLFVKADFGDDYVKIKNSGAFNVEVNFTVNGTLKKITLTDLSPESTLKIDLLSTITTASGIVISNISTNIAALPNGSLKTYLQNNIRLSAMFERTYAVDVRYLSGTKKVLASGLVASSPVITNRLAHFQWHSNTNDGYPNYELHILKVDNTDMSLQNDPNNISTTLDWSKALVLETQSSATSIDLTIAEGTGFYVWRVRPIGNFFEGGIANSQNYGNWSFSAADNSPISLNKNTLITGSIPDAFYFNDPDENINWIYNRVFTEGDNINSAAPKGVKVKEGMNYADGLQRSRQSQTYNSSNQTTVVSQTVIDYSGRPAVSTLPVPVKGGLNGYKTKFAQNSNGDVYSAEEFDTETNVASPEAINDGSSAYFNYYSNNQLPNDPKVADNKNVANAEGFPYSRVTFKTDGTGRKTEESGVGKMHSIGATSDRGKTTKYFYETASDYELLRIFGDEAPLSESVIKTTIVDANGVASITYTSKEGKTIATALNATNSKNLMQMDGATATYTVTNIADQNVYSDGAIRSSKRIAVPFNQTIVTLDYDLGEPPSEPCVSGGCNYKLRFYIVDLNTGTTYISDANGNLTLDGYTSFAISTGSSFQSVVLANPNWCFYSKGSALAINPLTASKNKVMLPAGEYMFVKELYTGNAPDAAEAIVRERYLKYKPILDAIGYKMKSTSNNEGLTAFNVFLADFKVHLDDYKSATPTTTSDDLLIMLGISKGVHGAAPANYVFPKDFTLTPPANTPGPTSDFSVTIPLDPGGCGGCGEIKAQIPKPDICYPCDGTPGISDPLSINGMIAANASAVNTAIAAGNDADVLYGINQIRKSPDFASLSPSEKRDKIDAIVDMYFIQALKDKLVQEELDPNDLSKITPGLSYAGLKFMISNMLISKYYTGSAIYESSSNKWYRSRKNATTGLYEAIHSVPDTTVEDLYDKDLIAYNYECKKVYDAWKIAVSLINSFKNSDDQNMVDGFNDQDGDSSAQKEANDDENWDDVGWFMKRKLNKGLDAEMSDMKEGGSNSSTAHVSKSKMDALTNVLSNFINQAGYQFAAIVDGDVLPHYIDANGDNIPDDYASGLSSTDSYMPFLKKDDGTDETATYGGISVNLPTYPYIEKPEWMFKYFKYNVFNSPYIPDDNYVFPIQVQTDLNMCYKNPASYLSSAPSLPPCQVCDENNLHYNWNKETRYTFYAMIKDASPFWQSKVVVPPMLASPPLDCEGKPQLIAKANAEIDSYKSDCSAQAGKIKANLIYELENNACYTIVDCQTTSEAGKITMKQIDAIVKKVVQQCETQMEQIRDKLPGLVSSVCTETATTYTPAYGCDNSKLPKCEEIGCVEIYLINNGGVPALYTEATKKLYTTLFQTCDIDMMVLYTRGDFLPKITPIVGSPCADKTPDRSWPTNNCGTPCAQPACVGDKYQTDSAERPVTAGQKH